MGSLFKGASLSSIYKATYTVDKFLDSGTQASVYLVSSVGKKYALKWYSKTDAALVKHFRDLIQNGAPKDADGKQDKRFIWPQDLIETEDGFGYTMDLIEMSKYITLHRLTHYRYIKEENYITGKALCDICINIAEAFKNLHSFGYCYKDISSNNIVFNVKTGEVLIFDVDNVVVSGEVGEIQGTPKFMAPEVILGKIHPDKESDRLSLASYFFHLLVGHYPFEGKLRDDYIKNHGALDDAGFKEVFGTNAVFCFNPNDTRNNLKSNDYDKVVDRWESTIPQKLKDKFLKTFVKGLPFDMRTERTTNKEWITLFNEFKQNLITCSCEREYFADALKCPICKKILTVTSVKVSVQENGIATAKEVILKGGSTIKGGDISNIISNHTKLAEVIVNPKTGDIGLKNLSTLKWWYKDVNGNQLEEVLTSSIVKLKKDRIIAFLRGSVQIKVI